MPSTERSITNNTRRCAENASLKAGFCHAYLIQETGSLWRGHDRHSLSWLRWGDRVRHTRNGTRTAALELPVPYIQNSNVSGQESVNVIVCHLKAAKASERLSVDIAYDDIHTVDCRRHEDAFVALLVKLAIRVLRQKRWHSWFTTASWSPGACGSRRRPTPSTSIGSSTISATTSLTGMCSCTIIPREFGNLLKAP